MIIIQIDLFLAVQLTRDVFFLHGIRYVRAVETDPAHANNRSNYGLFLADVKQDFKEAELQYQVRLKLVQAIETLELQLAIPPSRALTTGRS